MSDGETHWFPQGFVEPTKQLLLEPPYLLMQLNSIDVVVVEVVVVVVVVVETQFVPEHFIFAPHGTVWDER